MKGRKTRFYAALFAAALLLCTVFAAGPGFVYAASGPSESGTETETEADPMNSTETETETDTEDPETTTESETTTETQTETETETETQTETETETEPETTPETPTPREPYEPVPNGTIYNAIQHFLYHVVARDHYSFYDTIPCTAELRECIGYLLDAYQSQGVDLISRFNLHPSASYPYANVRNFCAQLDKELSPGDTVSVPCGNTTITFLYQKYNTTDAAYAAGALDLAGTIALVTSPNETYGHCWISLGRFASSFNSVDSMRLWLENYYELGDGALSGTIATGDATKVWKSYSTETVWRVHATRWSANVHGGCIVDNARAGDSLSNAPCAVLIPMTDAQPSIAQGDLSIQLSSALPAITTGNANYALSGAAVGIYTDAACMKQLTTVTTDANGKATVHHLAAQTVYVKVKSAPYGYEAGTAKAVSIPNGGTASLTLSLSPSLIRTQIAVQPQSSSASLDGAVFAIRFYACTGINYLSNAVLKGVWTVTADSDGAAFDENATVVQAPAGTDGFYKDGDGRIVFPLGFIAIEQTQAAPGQSLGGSWNVSGTAGNGAVPATGTSSQSGSNAPILYFTAAYQTLQSAASDGTTSFLLTVSPSGALPDAMQPKYKLTAANQVTGLWFGTNTTQFTERMGLSPSMSCTLLGADGKAKTAGSLMKTGDIVRVYDRTGALYYEGTVLIYGDVNGDGVLRMSDLIKVRNHILGTNPLSGVYREAADCNHDTNIRMSDLIKIRNEILGSGTIAQTAP